MITVGYTNNGATPIAADLTQGVSPVSVVLATSYSPVLSAFERPAGCRVGFSTTVPAGTCLTLAKAEAAALVAAGAASYL